MEGGPLKLSPVPSELVARGWIFLALHVSGVLVALPSVQHRAVTLGLCAANGVLFGLLALASWRYAVKRIVAAPPEAVVVARRIPNPLDVISVLGASAIVVAVVVGLVDAAVLGIGIGGAVGLIWGAHQIRQFERTSDRRVLRRVGWRALGEPHLYAALGPAEPPW